LADLGTKGVYPDKNCRTQSNGHKQSKEQRELTQVHPQCGGATEKVDPEASLRFYCGGPLFGRSRPLTAQKRGPAPRV
jgi:hypothetical protein